ncbi:MAG: hypothetical protein CR994_00215 [Maribacter sp.]|nr:MAG: hypothetical protein CR994_00215 [Maribacter sp.]
MEAIYLLQHGPLRTISNIGFPLVRPTVPQFTQEANIRTWHVGSVPIGYGRPSASQRDMSDCYL